MIPFDENVFTKMLGRKIRIRHISITLLVNKLFSKTRKPKSRKVNASMPVIFLDLDHDSNGIRPLFTVQVYHCVSRCEYNS
jgi:hypothetical protein